MASKSRWADTEEDAALDAQRKREKEEKKRLKAEKLRKAAAEEEAKKKRLEQAALDQDTQQQHLHAPGDGVEDPSGGGGHPPAKRRKVTPDPTAGGQREGEGGRSRAAGSSKNSSSNSNSNSNKLLRFEADGGFGRARGVDNYDKLNDIEEGAYGWVARARDVRSGRVVALKRLKVDAADRAGLPETGLREMQILKDCAHRNVVRLHEVVVGNPSPNDIGNSHDPDGDDDDPDETPSPLRVDNNIFLVLEFLEHDLKSVLEDMPEPFLASEVKTLLLQLSAGVAYLHDRWVLHRDLKTSNLLLNNRGTLKIADFGMARYAGDPKPARLTPLVVTLWYRAPELLLGTRTYGTAVDMWSVGCIFGELLTREPLLQGRNEVDELARIFELCGTPTDDSWPGFRRLPHARSLKLPPSSSSSSSSSQTASLIRARFPLLTTSGCTLLASLLSLDPAGRPSARDVLAHDFFRQDPRPKHEALFPTFPSKAGREQQRRRRHDTPDAPGRGASQQQAAAALDFSGVFAGRDREERGAGFALRMV